DRAEDAETKMIVLEDLTRSAFNDKDYDDQYWIVTLEPVFVDLDIDSDNTGSVSRSSYEDAIEAADDALGVLVGNAREPMIVELSAGSSATLVLAEGSNKVTLWSAEEYGSEVISAAQPAIVLQATPGGSSTTWTFWIHANVASDATGDVSFKLMLGGDLADSALIDVVRVTAAPYRNHAPEFQSDATTAEDAYAFSVFSSHVGVVGNPTATDVDGDVLTYSGESENFRISADGALEVRSGALLLPGTYQIQAMVQDPFGEFDLADMEVVVVAPDIGIRIEGLSDAVEGSDLGLFWVARSDASGSLDIVVEVATAPLTIPAAADDYIMTLQSGAIVGSSFTIHFKPGQYVASIVVDAIDDGIAELIEDLSLRISSYAAGGATVSVAAFNMLATIMLVDAQIDPAKEWQQIGNGPHYRAISQTATLTTLAMITTGNMSNWTSIWPSEGSKISRWSADGDFNTSPQMGAHADVSNLIEDDGPIVVVFGIDGLLPAQKFVDGASNFFPKAAAEARTQGKQVIVSPIRINGVGDIAALIQRISGGGKKPIGQLVIAMHWFLRPVAREDVPEVALNWNDVAEVKLNSNLLATAQKRIGPVRGWFTRNAIVNVFGCNTAGLAQAYAEEYLPRGATAKGTTAVAFCWPNFAGFDQDGDGTLNLRETELRWKSVKGLLEDAPEWQAFGAAQ
ncbi:MAG: hypothetical protein SH868_05460, partial [Bythopirellula sp.]|nr:hypothetical protein [Bythopirellula sp.]MDZ4855420.1 hypothetical protein [Nitrospirota bacterium]